jgi:hypothetical protein
MPSRAIMLRSSRNPNTTYVREALYSVKLAKCGLVEADVTTIQNLLDQYKLRAKEDDKIHVFYLLQGISKIEEWDLARRFIHQRLDEDGWYTEPDKMIQNLKDREAELQREVQFIIAAVGKSKSQRG